jgi:hypothetical protein
VEAIAVADRAAQRVGSDWRGFSHPKTTAMLTPCALWLEQVSPKETRHLTRMLIAVVRFFCNEPAARLVGCYLRCSLR